MPEADQGTNPVHDFIVSAVKTAWDDTQDGSHKAMLLSALGTKLKNEFANYSTEFPKGIKEFLRTWPVVQMVQHPEIVEKIGLVPSGELLPDDLASLFQKAGERRSSGSPISYDQDFWNAFFKPIHSTRHVVIGENGQLQILNDVAPAPRGAYEITKNDIVAPDQVMPMSEKVAATRERIDNWLAKNNLGASRFLRKHVARATISHDRIASLKHAFENISDGDRSRITIPLDIILKILS
ncbi:hypothetical protein U1839_03755 [Sphingomonas sp. RT2P30]|uniref:hypothetical protein n=1 Tax=Parasphingomonas halimpatiens TaxID=3096162 RepID=UPI002FCC982E